MFFNNSTRMPATGPKMIAAIKAGIRKINFGTDVCCSFIEGYKELDPYSAPLDVVMAKASEYVKDFAIEKIKLLGAAK